jgi:hypothetical protein
MPVDSGSPTNVHGGSVDHDIGGGAHVLEHRALAAQRLEQRDLPRERMGAARLGEAPDERLLRRVEEEQAGSRDAAPQPRQDLREPDGEVGIADVEDDADALPGGDLVEQGLDELEREVVDAEVAHVLEALVDVALPRSREPGHDDEALRDVGGGSASRRRHLHDASSGVCRAISSSTRRANSFAAS